MIPPNLLEQQIEEIAINFRAAGTDDEVGSAVLESPDEPLTPYLVRLASVAFDRNVLHSNLPRTIHEMQTNIEELERRVAELEETVQHLDYEEEVIELRSLTREQAKEEILDIFQSEDTLFYSDIAKRLGIDLQLVVEICQELEEEGDIEVDADYSV